MENQEGRERHISTHQKESLKETAGNAIHRWDKRIIERWNSLLPEDKTYTYGLAILAALNWVDYYSTLHGVTNLNARELNPVMHLLMQVDNPMVYVGLAKLGTIGGAVAMSEYIRRKFGQDKAIPALRAGNILYSVISLSNVIQQFLTK